MLLYVLPLFFLTGLTALSAEVVLNRLLTYVFGSSHLATSTVLAAYMSGLTIGAFAMGCYTQRLKRPIMAFGVLELLVALFLVLLPALFELFRGIALNAAAPLAQQPFLLTLVRFVLAFVLVLIPTVMMGGTLPTLVTAFKGGEALRRQLPLLYAVNTLGAAAGTLLSAYVLIPTFGLDGTLNLCGLIDMTVAGIAVLISRQKETASGAVVEVPTPEPVAAQSNANRWRIGRRVAFLLALGQGFVAFMLEVVWAHLIGTVIGVTIYAFALMLTVILLGIGIGSLLLPALNRRASPAAIFIWAQVLLAAGVIASLFLWDRFPDVIAWTLSWRPVWTFTEREIVRFVFVLTLLLPATLAMGAALPSLAALVEDDEGQPGKWVGALFSCNTIGTILGALSCGFLFLGRFPSHVILIAGAAGALGLSLLLRANLRQGEKNEIRYPLLSAAWGGAVASIVVLIAVFPGWDILRLTAGSHYYWAPADNTKLKLLYCEEDAQSGFITVKQLPDGMKRMETNGKYEGTDAPVEFQDNFALFGAMYVKNFEHAALIGLGPGRTLANLYAMPFKQIDMIEFSPQVIAAAYKEFGQFAKVPLDDKSRVNLICDDGRNHLQLSPARFDYIAVGITGAAFSGASNIYSRHFYDVIRRKLTNDGVFLLWLQLHHVLAEDVRSVVYTLRDVFKHVHFYTDGVGAQGFLVASQNPLTIDPRITKQLTDAPFINRILKNAKLESLNEMTALVAMTTDTELARLFSREFLPQPPELYDDYYPKFEYSTPKGLASGVGTYNFAPLSAFELPRFDPPLPEGELAALQGLRFLVARQLKAALPQFEKAYAATKSERWKEIVEQLKRTLEQKPKP